MTKVRERSRCRTNFSQVIGRVRTSEMLNRYFNLNLAYHSGIIICLIQINIVPSISEVCVPLLNTFS